MKNRPFAATGSDRIDNMRVNGWIHRFTAWIATFAILAAALLPSVSLAVPRAPSTVAGQWMEVCSVAGMKMVNTASLGDPVPGAPDKLASHATHCQACSVSVFFTGVPVPFVFLKLDDRPPGASLQLQAPALASPWASAQSRAPPSLV
jgi:hypothetical protein